MISKEKLSLSSEMGSELFLSQSNALRNLVFKHRASLYLKAEALSLSIAIIFKAFYWLKDTWLSLLLRQRKVILCCCEATLLIIAELTYSLTYQMIISSIPSIRDFVYIHIAQKIL